MNRIHVRSDFEHRPEYRLVSIEDAGLRQFCTEPCIGSCQGTSRVCGEKRGERGSPVTTTRKRRRASVALILKGKDQLCLHDALATRSVHRVEYSNVMLLAKRRRNDQGRAALDQRGLDDVVEQEESQKETSSPTATEESLRASMDDVVIASLNRMFDSHAAHPQRNISAVLSGSYLTIEELEGVEVTRKARDGGSNATASSCYTFAQLAREFRSSPTELAGLLQDVGAVIHRGHVRLLHPSTVYEALEAVLTYFDAAEPSEASWEAARTHFCPSAYPEVVLRVVEAVYGATSSAKNVEEEQATTPSSDPDGVLEGGLLSLVHHHRVLRGLAGRVFDQYAESSERRTLSTGEETRGLALDLFLEAWVRAIPSCLFGVAGIPQRQDSGVLQALLDKLRGQAVVASPTEMSPGGDGGPRGTIWWLPSDSLSNEFVHRLRSLFELRPQRWDLLDLKEYLQTLLPPDQAFERIIVRYAREYRIPGKPVQYAPLT